MTARKFNILSTGFMAHPQHEFLHLEHQPMSNLWPLLIEKPALPPATAERSKLPLVDSMCSGAGFMTQCVPIVRRICPVCGRPRVPRHP